MHFIQPPVLCFSNMLPNQDLDSKKLSTNIACMPLILAPVLYFSVVLPNKDSDPN